MNQKVADALIQVYETLVPPEDKMKAMPSEAQSAIHGMAHFAAGLMVGTQMHADAVQSLATNIKETQEGKPQAKSKEPINPRASTG